MKPLDWSNIDWEDLPPSGAYPYFLEDPARYEQLWRDARRRFLLSVARDPDPGDLARQIESDWTDKLSGFAWLEERQKANRVNAGLRVMPEPSHSLMCEASADSLGEVLTDWAKAQTGAAWLRDWRLSVDHNADARQFTVRAEIPKLGAIYVGEVGYTRKNDRELIANLFHYHFTETQGFDFGPAIEVMVRLWFRLAEVYGAEPTKESAPQTGRRDTSEPTDPLDNARQMVRALDRDAPPHIRGASELTSYLAKQPDSLWYHLRRAIKSINEHNAPRRTVQQLFDTARQAAPTRSDAELWAESRREWRAMRDKEKFNIWYAAITLRSQVLEARYAVGEVKPLEFDFQVNGVTVERYLDNLRAAGVDAQEQVVSAEIDLPNARCEVWLFPVPDPNENGHRWGEPSAIHGHRQRPAPCDPAFSPPIAPNWPNVALTVDWFPMWNGYNHDRHTVKWCGFYVRQIQDFPPAVRVRGWVRAEVASVVMNWLGAPKPAITTFWNAQPAEPTTLYTHQATQSASAGQYQDGTNVLAFNMDKQPPEVASILRTAAGIWASGNGRQIEQPTAPAEQPSNAIPESRRGPRGTPPEARTAIIDEWLTVQHETTQESYCAKKGISVSTLRKWIREARRKQ